MKTIVTARDAELYREQGYAIFRGAVPPALVEDLRRTAEEARAVARRVGGPQAQRIHDLGQHVDVTAVRAFAALPEFNAALRTLLTPRHALNDAAKMTFLFEPAERCWATEWHRDWRDHMTPDQWERVYGGGRWERMAADINMLNQLNCALYEDTSTWFVPGSAWRMADTPAERAHAASADRSAVENWKHERSEAAQEAFLHEYCAGMPGAVQLQLNAGDLVVYRNAAWHIGNYVPYRKRAALHCTPTTPEFDAFLAEAAATTKRMKEQLEEAGKTGEAAAQA